MIRLTSHTANQAGVVGKEPTAVIHDLHNRNLFTNEGIMALLDSVADESIKAKVAYQQRNEEFNTSRIPRAELIQLINDQEKDCWIVLHRVESNPLLRDMFMDMVTALQMSLPKLYGDVRYCTGSVFISRGKASTPFHLDYGSNMLLQLRGNKHFLAFSPNDPALVSKQSLREFFGGKPNPPSLKYDASFEQKALVLDLEPGMGVYMPSTSPHCTETRTRDLSVTVSLSFVSPLADRLRRSSLFDAKLLKLRFVPESLKCGTLMGYEMIQGLRGGYQTRHSSFRALPL